MRSVGICGIGCSLRADVYEGPIGLRVTQYLELSLGRVNPEGKTQICEVVTEINAVQRGR